MNELIAALGDPACYRHPVVGRVEVRETHISWVLLAGEYAYKVKKPVRLAFLDFSTLDARRRYCEEELRLNRRTAPELYLAVVPIVNTPEGPRIEAPGDAVEYAVKMRRFPDDALADAMARRGALGEPEADAIVRVVAAFHAAAARAAPDSPYGAPQAVAQQALDNFAQIEPLVPPEGPRLARLAGWTGGEAARLAPVFAARRAGGFVRECHGDLHLGNIAFVEDRAVPFDCIEFDPALRWIDVMNEMAFLFMDLAAHGLEPLAWRALNGWLEETGDYEGVRLLRFYAAYRAMVRAKVALLAGREAQFAGYLALAERLARSSRPALVLMHGLPGSGKTTVAGALAARLGAVRLRSDVERKRLAGLAPLERAAAAPGEGIYEAATTRRTYARLAELAGAVLDAGWPAIVDAAFALGEQRALLRREALARAAPCLIAACEAPQPVLRERLRTRQAAARDASDADVAILEHQLAVRQPLAPEEQAIAERVDTGDDAARGRAIRRIAARLAARPDAFGGAAASG
jgi:aminoglycoside phosphotransferase family enzyme/predicted kinase